jgi:hypothetical protein
MPVCPHCQHEYQTGMEVCTQCGRDTRPDQRSSFSFWRSVLWIVLVVLTMGLLMLTVAYVAGVKRIAG